MRLFFFFSSRRRHTTSLCDWSSDVCSSDLRRLRNRVDLGVDRAEAVLLDLPRRRRRLVDEIGRASCRERVYSSVLGVSLKKPLTGFIVSQIDDPAEVALVRARGERRL